MRYNQPNAFTQNATKYVQARFRALHTPVYLNFEVCLAPSASMFQSFLSPFITQPTTSTYADIFYSTTDMFSVKLPTDSQSNPHYRNLNYFIGTTNNNTTQFTLTAQCESTKPAIPDDQQAYVDLKKGIYYIKFRSARIFQQENYDGYLDIGVANQAKTVSYKIYAVNSLTDVRLTGCGLVNKTTVLDY